MSAKKCPFPHAESETGLRVLKSLARERTLLAALKVMQEELGNYFQITMPGFKPAVVAGAEANRHLLVSHRDEFRWRTEQDAVTRLLRHGLLVEDGPSHDRLRAEMDPPLQRRNVSQHVPAMIRYTDQILAEWADGSEQDMLVEMRRAALLILIGTLFNVDFTPDLDRLWQPILKMLKYISPGLWIVWPDMPRLGYKKALTAVDDYLYQIIADRRTALNDPAHPAQAWDDLLTRLVKTADMDDDLIRDQLLTMLIAGHDTSTALLAWVLYLLGRHPEAQARARAEVDELFGDQPPQVDQLGRLHYLDLVIKETLRLYPPIHVGNRQAPEDLAINGYQADAGCRVMYSIYLSHRDPQQWADPDTFRPERFDRSRGEKQPAFAYVPFGGGPRNCIGAAYAQIEAKAVLARILQKFDLELLRPDVTEYMGATLEPRPGVQMRVHRRVGHG